MRRTTGLLFLALLAAPAAADEKKAREEVERELQQLVGKQPTRVKVEFVGVDEPNYVLEEAEFELDGTTLKAPPASALDKPNPVTVWQGDAKPGKHTLTAHLVYANKTSAIVSDEGGYKWKLASTVSFDLFAGIEVQLKVTPTRVPGEKDVSKRFRLTTPAAPVMLARLDDGKMPEPIKRPEAVDAGAPEVVAAVDPKQKAKEEAEAKRLAAIEEKKAKAEAVKAAKEEAARAAKEIAAAKAEARKLAAEEKKRLAEEKKRALEEAKLAKAEAIRKAKEEAELKKHPELAAKQPDVPAESDAGAAETPDAGALAEVDAGAPVAVAVAAPQVPDAGVQPQAAPAEEGGVPWLPIGIGGAVVVVALLVVIARRRANVPKVDE